MAADYNISLGRTDDIPGILALQEINLAERGGSLSVRQTADWFRHAILETSLLVGRRERTLVGYVLGTALTSNTHVMIIQTMLRAFPPPPDCYLYGPVCVAETERGKGLAAALFVALQERMSARPAMTFVRADNSSSLRAHRKLGMRELGLFVHDDMRYIALGYNC
jgi:ribosomal protein S18 acetylase RimI-like enzyme